MNQKNIKNEVNPISNRKPTLGLRCSSGLKFKLTEEAAIQGISLSEYCESILLNKDMVLLEKEKTINESEALKQKILTIEANSNKARNQCVIELEKANAAAQTNHALKVKFTETNIFQTNESNKRILILFILFVITAIGIFYHLSNRKN